MSWHGSGTERAYVRLDDVVGVGRPFVADNHDYAFGCRVVFLRGGGEITILDTVENMEKLGIGDVAPDVRAGGI